MRYLPWLIFTGCLLGSDPLKGAPNVPTLDGDPILLEPQPDDQGDVWAREGTEVVVFLRLVAPIDLDSSEIRLDDGPMGCTQPEAPTPVYRCTRTLDGTETNGPKGLAGTLTFRDQVTTAPLVTPPLLTADFIPPTGSCVLSPRFANASDAITFVVTPSEPLREPPTVTPSDPALLPMWRGQEEGQFLYEVVGAPNTNLLDYTLTVEAVDRAGNPQRGDSLCTTTDRTGSLLGRGPALSSDITLTATPSLDDGGVPRAAEGATVTVTIPTEQPISPTRSFVSLSGFALSSTDGTTWTGTLDPVFGDGLKTLTATLVDDAGNTLVVQDPTVALLADFTPPQVASAALTRTPFFPTADDGSGAVLFTTTDPLTGQAVSASLRVTTTEDLGQPALLDVHGPGALAFTPTGGAARLATWALPAIPDGQDGTYTFTVTLEDAVGNRSEPVPLEVTLEIDTEGPAAGPDVDTPDLITYLRQPWGPSSVSGSPTFRVQGAAGAAPPDVLVVAENASGGQLGSALSSADGAFDLAFGADTQTVFLRAHDRAGNPSPRAAVRDVTWTATMAGKVPGSTRENPHWFHEASFAQPTRLVSPPEVTSERSSAVATTAAEPPWLPWEGNDATGETPPARSGHALAYDAARGVTVLFGGFGTGTGACGTPNSQTCSDTWEWDGTSWTEVTPPNSPPARSSHALAYDAARGVTVLFGGYELFGTCGTPNSQTCSDTWEWDGTSWTEVTPPNSPPARSSPALAYDAARGVTVLFGGTGTGFGACGTPDSSRCSDTWEWDGTTWTQRNPATSPPARSGHALAYDAARGVTVMYGSGETWEWDGRNWTEVTPANSPPPRSGPGLAYDTERGVTVLFGGFGTANGACGTPDSRSCSDTWEWNGATWTQRTPATSPPARTIHALAYDAARGVTVLFGGRGTGTGACGTPGNDRCSDTWEWDGSTWTERNPATSPAARDLHSLAYDSVRGVTVLFGGDAGFGSNGACGTSGSRLCSDTWEWDGTTWTEVTPATSPPARGGHALAYDAARGVTVLFGGTGTGFGACGTPDSRTCSDTWEWDGTTWTQRNPATSPPARLGHAVAYDAARGVTVLTGGRAESGSNQGCGMWGEWSGDICPDTWEWDGTTWTDVTPLDPIEGYPLSHYEGESRLAYDAARGVTVLVGQYGTWEWDGISWTEATPDIATPERSSHALSYDTTRGVTILFGGWSTDCDPLEDSPCFYTWEWDGTSWTQRIPTSPSPSERYYHALAYDTARGTSVLFGGVGDCPSSLCSDTWLLPSDSPLSPRHTFIPAFAAALAPDATLRTVTARWIAGGSGTPGGDLTEGAELLVWNGLGWTVLDAHAAGPDAPAPLCARLVADETAPPDPGCTDLVDPGLVQGLFRFGPDRTATFAVRPTAPIGFEKGALRSEDVAVTMRYRLPGE